MASVQHLDAAREIFMLGIRGSGMRGLAYLLTSRGKRISGTDDQFERQKTSPDLSACALYSGEAAVLALTKSQLLIYSDAVADNHPLRQQAARQGKPCLIYNEAVGQLAAAYQTIAVAGTHGKSSTTVMLAHILVEAGLDPTVLVGATVPAWEQRSARVGHGAYFVVEADEYRDHFLALKPAHAIVTSIDFDHPDYFGSLTDVQHSFKRFLTGVDEIGWVVTSQQVFDQYEMLNWPTHTNATVALDPTIALSLFGNHMRSNAALAVAMAEKLKVPRQAALAALQTFRGLGRRMEKLGLIEKLTVVSDYGHHPTEIAATLEAARQQYPDQKIIILFEAHTLERLKAFGDDFAEALARADGVLLVPVFVPEGREIESQEAQRMLSNLATQLGKSGTGVWTATDFSGLENMLKKLARSFDLALAFSAGVLDRHLRTVVNQR